MWNGNGVTQRIEVKTDSIIANNGKRVAAKFYTDLEDKKAELILIDLLKLSFPNNIIVLFKRKKTNIGMDCYNLSRWKCGKRSQKTNKWHNRGI